MLGGYVAGLAAFDLRHAVDHVAVEIDRKHLAVAPAAVILPLEDDPVDVLEMGIARPRVLDEPREIVTRCAVLARHPLRWKAWVLCLDARCHRLDGALAESSELRQDRAPRYAAGDNGRTEERSFETSLSVDTAKARRLAHREEPRDRFAALIEPRVSISMACRPCSCAKSGRR